jgi:hypothetical protein
MSPVIFLWSHSRSASTAFVRMMIERGDVTVLHEPLLALTEEGSVGVPEPGGGTRTARSEQEVLDCLARAGATRPVFVKEVLDYRYPYLIKHPQAIARITHTFLVRDPRQAISSHYAIKPAVTCPEIGYERLHEMFELARSACGAVPPVIRTEQLLREPASVVAAYCAAVGLPFLPGALTWRPADQPEWRRTRKWHLDAIASSGFHDSLRDYPATVDNNPVLRAFYDHHYPFYERIVEHAI